MATAIFKETASIKQAVSIINGMDAGKFPRLLSRILQKLHLKAEQSFNEEEEEKLQAAFSLDKQSLKLVLETISFILEQAVYHNLKTPVFRQQLENIHLEPSKTETFASVWENAGPETVEKFRQRTLTPKKVTAGREQHNQYKDADGGGKQAKEVLVKDCISRSNKKRFLQHSRVQWVVQIGDWQLETTAWQLNLQMAQSTQAKMKSPQAVLELGVSTEDTKNFQDVEAKNCFMFSDFLFQDLNKAALNMKRLSVHILELLCRIKKNLVKKLNLEKIFVEFNHQELLEFYNKLETIQAQLDSLT